MNTRKMIWSTLVVTVMLLLSACGTTPPPTPTSIPPTVTQRPTEVTVPTATSVPYSTEVAPGATYGPPSLTESVYLEGSGGSGRDGHMSQAGMSEAELVVYETAVYDGAAKSGYTKDQIEIDYLYDTVHLSWNMAARLTSGNHLWSQRISDGVFSAFPLQVPYNEDAGEIKWDENYKLVEVQDSADAKALYTNGGAVILVGGSKVTIDGTTYYSQWFDTSSGVWDDITEVKTAYEAYLATIAPHDLEYYTDENNWEIVASEDEVIQRAGEIAALPSQLASDASFYHMGPVTYLDMEQVQLAGLVMDNNIVVRDALRIPIPDSQEYRHYFILETLGPDNLPRIFTSYVGTSVSTEDFRAVTRFISRIQNDQNFFTLSFTVRFIKRDYENLYLYDITDRLDPNLINNLENKIIPVDIWKTIMLVQFN